MCVLRNISQRPLTDSTDVGHVTSIDTLPDDVLLEIFNFHGYYDYDEFGEEREKAWQTLVHVCRRWRCIVFGSPRHLYLRLVCTKRTPARDMLDVWPALPLIVFYRDYLAGSEDNITAALKCADRVCQIYLEIAWNFDLDVFGAMQQPFPELTYLKLVGHGTVAVVPDSFLGGSTPRLEVLFLFGIPFPGLPKLLLSATHLNHLQLFNIPHSGYISPDSVVAVLSTLTSLSYFWLEFESPRSCPGPASRRRPRSTRSLLPGFTHFRFKGVGEYLEDLVACIDAPQLNTFYITFFNDIVFDTPQLVQFISHTPKWKALKNAHITLQGRTRRAARVDFSSQTSRYGEFNVEILCKGLDWQVSSLEQVCTSCLPPLSTLEDLYFHEESDSQPDWEGSVENRQWLELLRSFVAVKNLYLSEKFASRIGPALQELVEGRATDVLPALQNIFLKGVESSGSVQETIEQFVAARQVTNHPVGISPWTDSEESEV